MGKKIAPKQRRYLMAVLKYELTHMAVWYITVSFHTSTSALLGNNMRQYETTYYYIIF